MDKKILILLPIWKREKITRICLDNLRDLKKEFNIDVLCIVSESWAKVAAHEFGFRYIEASNDNLGAKMNVGIKHSLGIKYDYLMNLGSDDIISKELLNIYEPYLKKNTDVFGITKVAFLDSKTKEIKNFDYKVLIGAGRCIRKDLIEALRVDMYDKDIECGFDSNSMSKFDCGITEINTDFNMIIDIKSDVNIWNYEELPGEVGSFDDTVKKLNTNLIDKILEL